MVRFLKLLSIVTGSPEQTLLNARIEITSKTGGGGTLSSAQEKDFIFERFCRDLPKMFTLEQCNSMRTEEIIGLMIQEYARSGEKEILNAFNRVMVYFYNYELGNLKTLVPALTLCSKEFEAYFDNKFNK